MPLGDFVDQVMDVFEPLSEEPKRNELCQARATTLMSDMPFCCTPPQPAQHSLSTLGDEFAAGLTKPRGCAAPARFGRPLVYDETGLLNKPATTRARGYGVALHAGADEGGRTGLDTMVKDIVDLWPARRIMAFASGNIVRRRTPNAAAVPACCGRTASVV
jgi:hypothetical protein